MKNTFPSKLLLFGEHAILFGSRALAVPLWDYSAQWRYSNDLSKQYDLVDFVRFLSDLPSEYSSVFELDIEAFRAGLHRGLYLESTIPQGYGVGSSGALIAAICHRFARNIPVFVSKNDLIHLKNTLAYIESFFHGSSSGIDPLVCYLEKPLLISSEGIKTIDLKEKNNGHFFLIDTELRRQTATWVNRFKALRESFEFDDLCRAQLAVYNNDAITAYCQNDWDKLLSEVAKISQFQYDYMREFIPAPFYLLWKKGLDTGTFQIKICGAGGGGFILGFTKEKKKTEEILKKIGKIYKFLI